MISLRQQNNDVLRRFKTSITHATSITFLGMCISLLPIGKASALFAQQISTIPGSFIDVGFGTRPVAMGYAFVGLADDENATYWNTEGVTKADGIQVGLSQLDHWGLVTYNYAAITVPSFGQNQPLGIAVISSGDDMMSELSVHAAYGFCLLYTSPSPRDVEESRMPSSA